MRKPAKLRKANTKAIKDLGKRLEQNLKFEESNRYHSCKRDIFKDKSFFEDFTLSILYPSGISFDDIKENRNGIIPFVYYGIYKYKYPELKKVSEFGYRETGRALFWTLFDDKTDLVFDKDIFKFNFETYNSYTYSSLKMINREFKQELIENNKALFYETYSVAKNISREKDISFIDVSSALYQWLSGCILNYFGYQYDINSKTLSLFEGINIDSDYNRYFKELNEKRAKGIDKNISYLMTSYILNSLKDGFPASLEIFKWELHDLYLFDSNRLKNKPGVNTPYWEMWDFLESEENIESRWQEFVKEGENEHQAAKLVISLLKKRFPNRDKYPKPKTIKDRFSPNSKKKPKKPVP